MLPLSDIAVGRSIGVADTVGGVLLILQGGVLHQQNRVCPDEQHPTTAFPLIAFPLLSSLLPLAGWLDGWMERNRTSVKSEPHMPCKEPSDLPALPCRSRCK